MGYISVRNWRTFQHYDPAKRTPPWIKVYTELASDDGWLQLTTRQRGLLVSLWLAYAASRCKLGASPAQLGRMLGDPTVRARDLESLNHAGFIDIVASAALAEGYQSASPRARATETEEEAEVEKEKTQPTLPRSKTTAATPPEPQNGMGGWVKIGDIQTPEPTEAEVPF